VTRSLLLTGLRDLVRRPLHTGLMVLGVALGVAVVIAIDLANTSARRGFERSTEAVVGRATHRVVGGPEGIPQDLWRRIRVQGGLRASAPVVEGYVTALDLDRQPLRVLGVDVLSEGPFRPHLGGRRLLGSAGIERFLTGPRAVIVGSALAERYGLSLGSPLRVRVQDHVSTLETAGIVHTDDHDEAAALEGLLLMDVGAAQRLFGMGDRLSRIDLRATDDEAAPVRNLLPAGVRIEPAREEAAAAGQLTDAFQLNLTALSLLALVVGMLLIYNTVMFGVIQRRAVLGTLRLLGATGGQIFALVLLETAIASAVGVAFGLGLGWALGQGAVRLVTRTINDLYYVLAVSGAPLTLTSVAKGTFLGIGAGLLAAIAPAAEAARVEPIEALRPSTVAERARRLVPGAGLAGVCLLLLGGLVLALATRSLALSFAGLFAVVAGAALLAPAATVGAMAVAGPLGGRLFGTLGRLAARTITRSVSRTGVAIAALAVAVSVTIGVGLMIESFRATVANWLDLSLRADVFVSVPAAGAARPSAVLSPDVPARVAAVPGVEEVETFRTTRVASPLGEVQLAVVDPRHPRRAAFYRFAEGTPEEAWAKVRGGAVLVSEPFAFRHRLPARGGALALETDRGPRTFPVAGVFYDYSTERGLVLVSRDVYERFWDDRAVSSLGVYVAPGHHAEEVARALRAALAGRALLVTPHRALRAHALAVFDRTFAVTQALRLLAVVVAFIGVWSALLALQVERTRELATLEVLGLGGWRMGGLTVLETGLMGAVAGLLSIPLGWLLAALLVDVINVRSFGWTMRLEADPRLFVEAFALSVAAAVLASVYPLVRLRRRSLAAALRSE
jgi:putative ABC transport system permease protein